MSLPVVFRRKVGRDLAAGFGYYEGQTEGLGERFLAAVGSVLALVSRFPYAVFYRAESKRVVVLAVLHTARDPSIWPQPRGSAR